MPTPDTQHGATITLATDGVTLLATNIKPPSTDIGSVDVTNHSSTNQVETIPGDLEVLGETTVTYLNDGSETDPTKVIQTITVTAPLASGDTSAEKWAGSGFVRLLDPQDFASNSNAPQTKQLTIVWTGGAQGGSELARTAAS